MDVAHGECIIPLFSMSYHTKYLYVSGRFPMAGKGSSKRLAGRSAVAAVLVLVGSGLLTTRPGAQTPGTDALPFSKQFLVTGNYSVGTVDLIPSNQGNGFLSGTIPMSGVPANAEVVGAYLYWETISTTVIENDGALFRGLPITVVKKTARTLDPSLAP